jgi:hypothetical protein
MRTTVRLEDSLLERARKEAARRGVTLTALIQQALRLVLANPAKRASRSKVELPVCHAGGGTMPGVSLDSGSALLDRMERRG